MSYENNYNLSKPAATTDDTHEMPLTSSNPSPQGHGNTNQDVTTVAVQAVTLQLDTVAEGSTHNPNNKSPATPPEDSITQQKRPHTVSNSRDRASNHQSTTSLEAEKKRIASPLLGISPQSYQQECYRTDYLNNRSRDQVKTKVSLTNTAERQSKASITHNPLDTLPRANPKPNMEISQFSTKHKYHASTSHSGTEDYAVTVNSLVAQSVCVCVCVCMVFVLSLIHI